MLQQISGLYQFRISWAQRVSSTSIPQTIFTSTPLPETVDPGRVSCPSPSAEGLCVV